MGPIMLDVLGTSLTAEDKELLQHPLVGGLILFTRNYESPEQIAQLTADIRKAANKEFIVAVDHEGGRVQRFRDGFSLIPAMGKIWNYADQNVAMAQALAKQSAILMALEVQAVGIDISFAPILDIDDISAVIGDRAFHKNPEIVCQLASAFVDGLHLVGMKATGKHFPGHGSVQADSHLSLPIDPRSRDEIFSLDMLPFKTLINSNKVDALMPAHVIFTEVDSEAVGFSPYWLKEILRKELGFNGVIFSDDLSMEGAACVGGYVERAEAAQQAGCDMLLLCNNRESCIEVIDNANISIDEQSNQRLLRLLKTSTGGLKELSGNIQWQHARKVLAEYL
ncbi:MAG: beta-N-acetylhexosaminidase [Colwellia sp.]|nr:beta-N-acetylhexosaminidase [Colwellia sp.]